MQHSNLNDVRRVFSRIFPIHLLADILTVNIGNREPNSVHYKQKFGRSLPDDIMVLTKDYVIENEQDFDRIHYLGDWLADVVGSDEDHLMHPNFMVVCDLIEKWESVNVNLGEEDGSNSQA
jgi:hypothetical protein